jgi:hypothetical protein
MWYNTQHRGQQRLPAACPLPCWGAKMNHKHSKTNNQPRTTDYKLLTTKKELRKIHSFIQNKPNFRKSQINVTSFGTGEYVKLDTWSDGKNKPKQTQFKPNQSQNKPNSNPIKAKTNPISNPTHSI